MKKTTLSVARLLIACGTFCAVTGAASQDSLAEVHFKSPVRLTSGGEPIDVTVGHAAPYVMDVDGDGVRDLLVGEFGEEGFPLERLPEAVRKKWGAFDEGKLRIYRNIGTNDDPKFDGFKYMEAGGEAASIPTT